MRYAIIASAALAVILTTGWRVGQAIDRLAVATGREAVAQCYTVVEGQQWHCLGHIGALAGKHEATEAVSQYREALYEERYGSSRWKDRKAYAP